MKTTTDPFVLAEIQAQTGHFRDLLPEAAFDAFEEIAEELFTEHPVGVDLVRKLKPVGVVLHSEERAVNEDDHDEGEAAAGKRG
jgi:hypothetical protein